MQINEEIERIAEIRNQKKKIEKRETVIWLPNIYKHRKRCKPGVTNPLIDTMLQ